MKAYHKIMEFFWLITCIMSGIAAIYIQQKSATKDYMIFLLPLAALVMYLMRRYVRKKSAS